MANNITLEEAEHFVFQLPTHEQLKLVARISERLSGSTLQIDDERQRCEYAARVEDFLKMSEEMVAETLSEVNSAEDIRQLREERTSRL